MQNVQNMTEVYIPLSKKYIYVGIMSQISAIINEFRTWGTKIYANAYDFKAQELMFLERSTDGPLYINTQICRQTLHSM